jgi:hypothetical protein
MSDARKNKKLTDAELEHKNDARLWKIYGEDAEQEKLKMLLSFIKLSLAQNSYLDLELRDAIAKSKKRAEDSLVKLSKKLDSLVELNKKNKKSHRKSELKEAQDNQEAMRGQIKEFKKQLAGLSDQFTAQMREDDILIHSDESKRVEKHVTREQSKQLDKSDQPADLLNLIRLYSIIPPEPTRGLMGINPKSSTMPLKEKQAKEMELSQDGLSMNYAKYNQPGAIGSLSPESLAKLTLTVNKNKDNDAKKIEEYQQRINKLRVNSIKMFNHLYTIVPYNLLDEKIRNSNNFPAIVEEYIRVYQMHNTRVTVVSGVNETPKPVGSLLRPPHYEEIFSDLFKEYQNLENKVNNRQEQLRFYQYRDLLRNLINGFEVKKVITKPPFIPVQPLSPSSPLGSNLSLSSLSSPSSPDSDSTLIFNYRKDLSASASYEREVVISSSSLPVVHSLSQLEEYMKQQEKPKQDEFFRNLLLTAYQDFEKETLSLIQEKAKGINKNVSSKLFSAGPSKKTELEFYQKVLKNYAADPNKNKSITTHWKSLESDDKYSALHKKTSFYTLSQRINHTGPHPNAPEQKATPKNLKNKQPGH